MFVFHKKVHCDNTVDFSVCLVSQTAVTSRANVRDNVGTSGDEDFVKL